MTPKGKVYIEEQKKSAQTKLEARRVFLKEKGMNEDSIRKDATVRKLKAWVRKADFRLSSIAAQEKQLQDQAKSKAEKQAAKAEKKAAGKQPKKGAKEAAVPEKKEKKAKKEKPEKQAKAKEKKGGSEEKSPEEQAAAQ